MTTPATPEYIEELMQEVEEAEEPGNLREGQVLHRSNDDMPLGVQVASVASAGHVFIYNTKTGDRSKTNRNMLEDQLRKGLPGGRHPGVHHDQAGLRAAEGHLQVPAPR